MTLEYDDNVYEILKKLKKSKEEVTMMRHQMATSYDLEKYLMHLSIGLTSERPR